ALDIITLIILGSGLYLWWARGRKNAKPTHVASESRPDRQHIQRKPRPAQITPGQMWQTPIMLVLISLVGLIAALIGDGWHDALSWAALTLPVAVIVWKWKLR